MQTVAPYASVLEVLAQMGEVDAEMSLDALQRYVVVGSSRQYACSHGNHQLQASAN
jgi:hypothetical protein